MGEVRITSMDFGILDGKILQILDMAEILNFGALAIGNPIHFARPIMGDTKITPLDFSVWPPESWKSWKLPEF